MKKILLSLGVVLTSISMNAQVQNGNLETWAAGEPSNWTYDFGGTTGVQPGTNNFLTAYGEAATTKQLTGSAAAGSTGISALLETVNATNAQVIAAGFAKINGILLGEWPYTSTPATVAFDYIAQPAVDDTAFVQVIFYDAGGNVLGGAAKGWLNSQSTTSWANISLPIVYQTAGTVAKIEIYATSSQTDDNTPVTGSKLSIDNFVLNGTNGVSENLADLIKVFPNPANDVLNVSINGTIETVSIIGMDGKVVSSTLVNNTSTSVNVADLKAGVYFYEVKTANGATVRNTFVKQ